MALVRVWREGERERGIGGCGDWQKKREEERIQDKRGTGSHEKREQKLEWLWKWQNGEEIQMCTLCQSEKKSMLFCCDSFLWCFLIVALLLVAQNDGAFKDHTFSGRGIFHIVAYFRSLLVNTILGSFLFMRFYSPSKRIAFHFKTPSASSVTMLTPISSSVWLYDKLMTIISRNWIISCKIDFFLNVWNPLPQKGQVITICVTHILPCSFEGSKYLYISNPRSNCFFFGWLLHFVTCWRGETKVLSHDRHAALPMANCPRVLWYQTVIQHLLIYLFRWDCYKSVSTTDMYIGLYTCICNVVYM